MKVIHNNSPYMKVKRFIKAVVIKFTGNFNYEKVVILGKQRTGSSLLVTLLRSHPHLELKGEAFRLLYGNSCRSVWNENFGKKLPWLKYMGFKLFYNHPDDSEDREVWDFIKNDTTIRIIHIKRKDLLRTYVSKLIAEKTGAWRSSQEKKGVDFKKQVEIDIEDCIDNLRNSVQVETEFGIAMFPNHPYLELTYEELTTDIQGTMSKVLEFLEVKKIKVNSPLKRQNPEGLNELVSNYDDLAEALRKTEFGYLVD